MNYYNIIAVLFIIISDNNIYGLTGPNICQEEERYIENVVKPIKKPVQVRDYKWCLKFPPRCEVDRTVYVDDFDVRQEERVRYIEKCCPGYHPDPKSDKCISLKCRECKNGICQPSTGFCECRPGFTGTTCNQALNVINIRKWVNPTFFTTTSDERNVLLSKIQTTIEPYRIVVNNSDNIRVQQTTIPTPLEKYTAENSNEQSIANSIYEINENIVEVKRPFKYPTKLEEIEHLSKALYGKNIFVSTNSSTPENLVKSSTENGNVFTDLQMLRNINTLNDKTWKLASSTDTTRNTDSWEYTSETEFNNQQENIEETEEGKVIENRTITSNPDQNDNLSSYSLEDFSTETESNINIFKNQNILQYPTENIKDEFFTTEASYSSAFITENVSKYSQQLEEVNFEGSTSTLESSTPSIIVNSSPTNQIENSDNFEIFERTTLPQKINSMPANPTTKIFEDLRSIKVIENRKFIPKLYLNSSIIKNALKYPPRYFKNVRIFEDETTNSITNLSTNQNVLDITSSTSNLASEFKSTFLETTPTESIKTSESTSTETTDTKSTVIYTQFMFSEEQQVNTLPPSTDSGNKFQPFSTTTSKNNQLDTDIVTIKSTQTITTEISYDSTTSASTVTQSINSIPDNLSTPTYINLTEINDILTNETEESILRNSSHLLHKINEIKFKSYYSPSLTIVSIVFGSILALIASIAGYLVFYKLKRKLRRSPKCELTEDRTISPVIRHYLRRNSDGILTRVSDVESVLNPIFTAEPESTFGNLLNGKNDHYKKTNAFIVDAETLRFIFDCTYDHPSIKYIDTSFVGSTFQPAEEKNLNLFDHIYDEIPAWKQKALSSNESIKTDCNVDNDKDKSIYVTKDVTPEIAATKL